MRFDLQMDRVEDWIRDRGISSVALQFPEGLKARATEVSGRIWSDLGVRAVILGCPCYGACDLFTDYRRYAEGLVHFGHSPIPGLADDDGVLFVEARAEVAIEGPLRAVLGSLPDRVGLLASVQYVGLLEDAKRIIEGSGRTAAIGKGDGRIFYPGQVLGCNCSAALSVSGEVDCFLFIGEGDFHPLAAAFGVDRRLIVLDPMTGEARSVDDLRDRILRKRFAQMEAARGARSFLVVLCGKVGQYRPREADRAEAMLREAGREAHRMVADEVSPQALLPYRVDAFVSTACPRVAMDDQARYHRPMLTVPELEIVLGRRAWEDYAFDSIRGRPASPARPS